MVFTEVKIRNRNKYYYRILSIRRGTKVFKKRIYMGKNLSIEDLRNKENKTDKELYLIKREKRGEFNQIKKVLVSTLKKNGIKKAGIFGSYARGEQRKNSDIDILFESPKKLSLFGLVKLENSLKDKLKKKIDLVTYKSLSPLIKERVLNQEVKII